MKRTKATDAKVRGLKPKPGQRPELWFEGGLGIRVGASGNPPNKTWQTMCRIDRKLTRITLGHYPAVSVHEAGQVCGKVRDAIAKGEDYKSLLPGYVSPEEEEARGYLVRHLADDYLRLHARPRKKSASRDEEYIEREIIPKWGKRPASEITRRDVALLVEGIAERGAPVSANRVLSLLSKMFGWAVGTARIVGDPTDKVPKPAKEQGRERILSETEIKEMWKALDDPELAMAQAWRIALKLALVTGQRRAEIVEAPWSEFDLEPDKETWTIPGERAKNGRTHTIPLPALAVEMLLDQARDQSAGERFVFPGEDGKALTPHALSVIFARRRKQLGLAKKEPLPVIHDLRHTVQTGITSLGFIRLIADKITNHADTSIGGKYDHHDYMAEMTSALSAWSERIVEIVHGRKPESNVVSITAGNE